MRKFSKVALGAGGVCFALGISLCIAGWALGYEPGMLRAQYQERKVSMASGNSEYAYQEEFSDVDSLEISMGAAECQVTAWEENKIKVKAQNGTLLECKQDRGKLKVSYGGRDTFWNWLKMQEAGFVQIYVPKELILEELEVEGGAASISLEGLSCRELEMEVGAGSFSFDGNVDQEISVSCGAGSVHLLLDGGADDFDYKVSCGLGSVSVENGPNIAGIGENRIENRGTKKMKLECGLGSISAAFR